MEFLEKYREGLIGFVARGIDAGQQHGIKTEVIRVNPTTLQYIIANAGMIGSLCGLPLIADESIKPETLSIGPADLSLWPKKSRVR